MRATRARRRRPDTNSRAQAPMAAREPRTASEPRAPRRTCIGCRQVRDKGVLIRLVRGDDGEVKVDVNGRAPGRGAYVCPNERCLGKALAAGRLSHALRAAVRPPAGGADVILETWRRR